MEMIADDYSCKLAVIDSTKNEVYVGYVNLVWEDVSYIMSFKIDTFDGSSVDGALICMKAGDSIAVFEDPERLAAVRSRWLRQGRFVIMNSINNKHQ